MPHFIVTWLASGHYRQTFPIVGTNILDLEIVSSATQSSNFPSDNNANALHPGQEVLKGVIKAKLPLPVPSTSLPAPPICQETFVDPAILSIGKPSHKTSHGISRAEPHVAIQLTPKEVVGEIVENAVASTTSVTFTQQPLNHHVKPEVPPSARGDISGTDALATATLSGPFDDLSLADTLGTTGLSNPVELGSSIGGEEDVSIGGKVENQVETFKFGKRMRRRRTRRKGSKNGDIVENKVLPTPPADLPYPDTNIRKLKTRTPSNDSLHVPFQQRTRRNAAPPSRVVNGNDHNLSSTVGKHRRRDRAKASEVQNGWATEEATDIQEMGDFDFAANLSKFDKREVFNQIKHDDTTADEDRLVSQNQLPPRLGTAGGKNLHFTENVLDSPKVNGLAEWNSEAGDSESNMSNSCISSGRDSRRAISRVAGRKPPSRKGSALAPEKQQSSGSGLVADSLGKARFTSYERTASPVVKQTMSGSPYAASLSASKPTLRIGPSNKICPCLSPLQMLEFEQLAVSELGLTEDIITENAARGIAETVLRAFRLFERSSENIQPPLAGIAILAGNNRSGARAIAGGRQLQNHGFQVTTCVLGLDCEDDLLDIVRQQMYAYRRCGGRLIKATEMLDGMKALRLKPRLIIDALLGMHICFDDLRRDDQAVCFELVRWINRNDVQVVSIDVPSGVDASSGE